MVKCIDCKHFVDKETDTQYCCAERSMTSAVSLPCDNFSSDIPQQDEIVTNSHGGMQAKIKTSFSLVPHKALLAAGEVMKHGAELYEKDNWRKLTPDEIYDHLQEHLINWYITGDMEELSHAVTRSLMLYEVVVDAKV